MQEEKIPKKAIDKKQALLKAEHFCAYQERSQQEVRDKLYELGLWGNDVEETISELIQNNFINEERFAFAYALGKFRMKKWGKIKIKQGLKLKRVPEKLIVNALKQIDPEDYYETLRTLLEKKETVLTEKNPIKRKFKLIQYLTGKGFEKDLIISALNNN